MLTSTLVATLGMVLVCLAQDQSLLRALRVTTVGAGFVITSLVLRPDGRGRDTHLLPYASLLCGLGVVLLWRISPALASKQVVWMVLGLAALLATYWLVDDVAGLARWKYTAGALAVALLGVTMVLGIEVNGGRLWLGIRDFFVFQPGEVAKVLMCLFLAGYVADKGPIIRAQVSFRPGVVLPGLKYVGPLILMVMFCLAIFVMQRDLGAAALFFGLFVAVTYLATGRKVYALLSVILFLAGMVAATRFFPHVSARVGAWLNPWADAQGGGYQILQSLYSLAAGGVSGVGMGQGFPELLPAAGTDMIFSVAAEELGLAGTFALLLLYVLVTARSYSIAWRARHPYGALLAACLATVFGLQTLVIVGGCLRLVPLTGITLPFVSYGGTSVVVNFIALGLLLAVSRDCLPPSTDA